MRLSHVIKETIESAVIGAICASVGTVVLCVACVFPIVALRIESTPTDMLSVAQWMWVVQFSAWVIYQWADMADRGRV